MRNSKEWQEITIGKLTPACVAGGFGVTAFENPQANLKPEYFSWPVAVAS